MKPNASADTGLKTAPSAPAAPLAATESSFTLPPLSIGKGSAFSSYPQLQKSACSPQTPVGQLNTYLNNVKPFNTKIEALVQSLHAYNLDMSGFASLANDYMAYVASIPKNFCIGPSNGVAYDALDTVITRTNALVKRGIALFEQHLNQFINGALPLLQQIILAGNSINASSRDYTPVADAVARYNAFTSPYTVDIWLLSSSIQQAATAFNARSDQATQATNIALFHIENNFVQEAEIVARQTTYAEAALKHWETTDGKAGYQRYVDLVHYTQQTLAPALHAFLQKIPRTPKVLAAARRAEQAITYVVDNFATFPTFQPLPPAGSSFPYRTYGAAERKFGEAQIIAVLRNACRAHFEATGQMLHIGDMQLEHGGRISAHVSHKEGKDADVDAVEVGNVPQHNAALALEAAQRFLSAGARLVFYADQQVVDDANEWAEEHNIAGRLVFERDHTRHFHLRV